METPEKFLKALVLPLTIINTFGMVFAAIWLAILGKWGTIGTGVLFLLGGGMLLGIAMMPGLIFVAPAAALLEKGKKVGGYFFGFLGLLYTEALLVAWCLIILYIFKDKADSRSLIPTVLLSYGVATAAIGFLASKENNEFSVISTFFAQIAYLCIIPVVLMGGQRISVLAVFGGVMIVGLIIQLIMVISDSSDNL